MPNEQYGTGAIASPVDIRDYKFKASGTLTEFDIEKVIGSKLATKDQNGSFSCGGQAWAYYGEVLEALSNKSYEPRSAKWIYSHTAEIGGGSSGRKNSDFVIKTGWALESTVPSYHKNKPPKESFMIESVPVTQEILEETEVNRALSYLNVRTTFADIADAIVQNNGCIIGVNGADNGTWRSKFPKPPESTEWRHWVYAGKVIKIKDRWYIGIKNSWGDIGEDGWQYLDSSYFTNNVFEAWTLSWDYRPSLIKQIQVKTISLLKELVEVLSAR